MTQRCPVCLEGKAFQSLWRMRERCPSCGIAFAREPGFFVGAMYYSYGMGALAIAPLCVALWTWGATAEWIGAAALAQTLLFSPLLFRYSRILWMHMDQRFDPRK